MLKDRDLNCEIFALFVSLFVRFVVAAAGIIDSSSCARLALPLTPSCFISDEWRYSLC